MCRRLLTSAITTLALFLGVANAADSKGSDVGAMLLQQAESQTCTSSLTEQCLRLLRLIEQEDSKLSTEQRQRLHYLQAWRAAIDGDYKKSDKLSAAILDESKDVKTRIGSATRLVNSL